MTIELDTDGQIYTNTAGVSDNPAALLSADGTKLINDGRLDATGSGMPGFTSYAILITGDGGTIVNDDVGQITAANPFGGIAIQGGDGADSVINAGIISGDVVLGAGDDSFTDDPHSHLGVSKISLGDGNDTYHLISGSTINADGGAGIDTLIVDGSFDGLGLYDATNFETLAIGAITPGQYPAPSEIVGASGFSHITIAAGTQVALGNSDDPLVDLAIGGGLVQLAGTSLASVTGSSGADHLVLDGTTRVSGAINLAGGDDILDLNDNDGFAQPVSVDGGAGSDTVTVFVETNDVIDLSGVRNFEHLVLDPGGANVSHITGVGDITAGPGIYTIAASHLPNSFLYAPSESDITLAADVKIGRFGAPDAQMQKAALAAIQTATTDHVELTNNGVINGDVQLTMGEDYYNGYSGSVGGTIYGYAGPDQLAGGDGADIIDGGYGADGLYGGGGADTFIGTAAEMNGDTIGDLGPEDHIAITDADFASFHFSLSGDTLTYTGGALTLYNLPAGYRLTATADPAGGVDLALIRHTPENDFDGDGRSDILWRNDGGALSDWLGKANGGFAVNDANALSQVPASWHVAATGDFDGDGRSDILWRNDNGALSDWLGKANGGFTVNDGNALTQVPTSWHVAATGDFDGDGRSDILWRNDSGALSDWLGKAGGGFTVNDGNALTQVPTSWHVAATGDFNGDGRSDILWRNDSGALSDWLGKAGGGFAVNDAHAFARVGTDWHVAGAGDFNGDGRDDILWRNDNGTLSDWLGGLDGGFSPNDTNALTQVATSWHVAATGDYNGDGHADILWRNDNGVLSDWLGNLSGGFQANDAAALTQVPTNWHVQTHDYQLG